MSNVPTYEPETVTAQDATPAALRAAIEAIIPKDENIVSDIKAHDGVVDVAIRWKSIKWSSSQAIAGRDAKQMARDIDKIFREWLRGTVKNMYDSNGQPIPRHARAAADMKRWLDKNPSKRKWLDGEAA